jgi:hypothetical protein
LQKRRELYDRATSAAYSIRFTYKRKYVAAEWVGRFGWALDFFTAIVGTVLLYVLTRTDEPTFIILSSLGQLAAADLTIILLVSSLLSAFYGPKLRSRDYYNAGQELQELYDELLDYIEYELQDPDKEVSSLQEQYEEFNTERHHMNQSTPQLGGHWYRLIKWKQKYKSIVPWESYTDWEPPNFKLTQVDGEVVWVSNAQSQSTDQEGDIDHT